MGAPPRSCTAELIKLSSAGTGTTPAHTQRYFINSVQILTVPESFLAEFQSTLISVCIGTNKLVILDVLKKKRKQTSLKITEDDFLVQSIMLFVVKNDSFPVCTFIFYL